MDLSIVIVSWNVEKLLAGCLDSIYASPPRCSFEIWVVDNASTDGTPGMVRERFPQVQLIENHHNVGFAAANNQAIRKSTGEYVLLLNPDTVVCPGAIDGMMDYLEGHPRAGAAGPRLLNPDGSLQFSCSPAPTLWTETRRLLHLPGVRYDGTYAMAAWDPTRPRQVEVLLGACLLLRREVLQKVGLLDESFFVYSEEVDLCYRLMKAGWQSYWVPQAEVVHYGGQSTRQVAPEMFYQLYRGKVLYFRKHRGWFYTLVYKFILFIASLARVVADFFFWLVRDPRHQKLSVAMKNYRRLLVVLPRL
jgi:N-acetylglucosaminyl-diphospho-decaprenol L-rhamnosyltransferase